MPRKFSREEHQAFANAINDNPSDHTPRLVYSDYLEENGLHHDDDTLDALRDESDGDVNIIHHDDTGKVSVRKDQYENIESDPWNPELRRHQAEFLQRENQGEETRLSRHHREFADWLDKQKGWPDFGTRDEWVKESLGDPDYTPSMAEEHTLHREIGYPEYPADPDDEWDDENWGDGQMLFSDGSVLTRHSSGALYTSRDSRHYNPREYEDEDTEDEDEDEDEDYEDENDEEDEEDEE